MQGKQYLTQFKEQKNCKTCSEISVLVDVVNVDGAR
jgi:hypothetical protein